MDGHIIREDGLGGEVDKSKAVFFAMISQPFSALRILDGRQKAKEILQRNHWESVKGVMFIGQNVFP
jgi:hypothetical protein